MKSAALVAAAAAVLAFSATVALGQTYDGRYDRDAGEYRDTYRDTYWSRPGGGWYPDWGADPNEAYYGGAGRNASQQRSSGYQPNWQARQRYPAIPGQWHPDWGADSGSGADLDIDDLPYSYGAGAPVGSDAGRIFHDPSGRAYTVDQNGVSRWIR